MRKCYFFLALIAMPCFTFSQTTLNIKALDSALAYLNQTHRFNGTVLYADHGTVFKRSFGITGLKDEKPLTSSSAFNLASMSKQFFAMCVMILKEEGKLNFNDDIRKYLPELPYEHITIRNLLTHTSGIPEYFDVYMQYKNTLDTLTNEKLVALYAKVKPPLDFLPGSKWQYCNTNYTFLVSIIERAAKMPIVDFFQKKIVIPLKLKNTYIYTINMPAVPANHVVGFEEKNGKRVQNDLIFFDGIVGDGNIYSSVEDLYAWEQSLYTEKLVKNETMKEALSPVKLNDGSTYPYGFGWFIRKENERFSHTGSWVGFKNIICRDLKNKQTLIVLSSSTNASAIRYSSDLFDGKEFNIPKEQLITHVTIVDGTGTPGYAGAIRIEGNKIKDVGNDLGPYPGEEVIDGQGKTLTPGFIDSHSHLDGSLHKKPEAIAALNQGITTIVVGQDGESDPIDTLKAAFKRQPAAINVATYTGHTSLRREVLGEKNLNRPATQAEIDKMKTILDREMQKGSLGLSTGLEYEEAFFSNRDEVLQLAKQTARDGGRYISHIRSEDVRQDDALDEIENIGIRDSIPVQVSHIKTALKDNWGNAKTILSQFEELRKQGVNITADCYPYTYWSSTMKVLFTGKDYTSLKDAEYATGHLFNPEHSYLTRFAADKSYLNKTISEIAALRGETPAKTLIALVAESDAYMKSHPDAGDDENIVAESMSDEDVATYLAWPNTNFCTDGADGGHPRGFGSFTRILGRYVREKKITSFEQAIYKMTSLAAEHTGIKQRGTIAAGQYADLVLIDPATVIDNATVQHPTALSEGVLKVWVNGECVYQNQQSTRVYPGVFIER